MKEYKGRVLKFNVDFLPHLWHIHFTHTRQRARRLRQEKREARTK